MSFEFDKIDPSNLRQATILTNKKEKPGLIIFYALYGTNIERV